MNVNEGHQSAAGATGSPQLDLGDIQGLILRGYSYFHIRYFVFKITPSVGGLAGARAFCGSLARECAAPMTITTAEDWGDADPSYCLNLGISNTGLKSLVGAENYAEVAAASNTIFSSFDRGAPAQAAFVGDTGLSDPSQWWPDANGQPLPLTPDDTHLVVALYTRSPDDREHWSNVLLAMIPPCPGGEPSMTPSYVQDADPLEPPPGSYKGVVEIHFGYSDGLSQPRIEGTPWDDPGDPNDDNVLVPAYNFAVSNASPYYTAHPLLLNGSFGAFRLLQQDVGGFEAFLAKTDTPELLAAKMCGRWRNGTPLEVSPDGPRSDLSELDLINFNYLTPTVHQKGPLESDSLGALCPYAAHTRRANPRDDTGVLANVEPDGSPAYAQQHRVRRFATPYGTPYSPVTADNARGLVGFFMGANLGDQFEFLMSAWLQSGNFRWPDASPNDSGTDPLFGPDVGSSPDFDYLGSSGYVTVTPLERFIVTKAGLYVFFPSIEALQWLSQGKLPPAAVE